MSPRFTLSVKPETRGGFEPINVPKPIPSLGTVKKIRGEAKNMTRVEKRDMFTRDRETCFLIRKFPL